MVGSNNNKNIKWKKKIGHKYTHSHGKNIESYFVTNKHKIERKRKPTKKKLKQKII